MSGPDLSGRHALVTGAGSGIGAAVARALAGAGARVSLAGRRREPLAETAAALGAQAGAIAILDVTDRAAVAAGVAAVEAEAGPVSILVNNAGRAASGPFERIAAETWDDMLAVNLTGAFLVTQAVLPGMLARRAGRIVNVASTAGLVGYPYVAAYVAAKHGLVGLTRALALEVARKGVTVNAVCPGFTETPLLDGSVATIVEKTGRTAEAARSDLARANPMGRLVTPEEVADAVVWLASPGAAAVNGQAIAIAGGEVMTG
ncbi:SDR family NAD(P)-dependent oxidoreductase [Prosthecomicrobium sp. N25]|uniref:SDR family NAD(P)-dependent oxidoreductase n=1 Tax=Prosthecomicrobium sp. N25 TaxID=3129254 RepID=UPI003077D502